MKKASSFGSSFSFSSFSRESNVDASRFASGLFQKLGSNFCAVYDDLCEELIELDGVVFHSYKL